MALDRRPALVGAAAAANSTRTSCPRAWAPERIDRLRVLHADPEAA